MSEDLEEFILTNKKAFNEDEPSPELWAKIAADLKEKPKRKSTHLYMWLGGVAAVFTVVIFGLLQAPKFINASDGESNRNIEMASKETHFRSLIIEKRDSLATFASSNPNLYKHFTADLLKLDEEYSRLQNELKTTPNKPVILEAIIKNREIQLRLLNQQLQIIYDLDSYKVVNQI